MNILLDYVFPISVITPTPDANTGFLKQVLVIHKPKDGGVTPGTYHTLTAASQASTYAGAQASAEISELFSAGLNRVFVLPMDTLDLATALEGHESDFFTILVSSDFSDDEIQGEGAQAAVVEVKASLKVQDILWTSKSTGVTGNATTIRYTTGNTGGAATVTVSTAAITIQIETGVTTAATIAAAVIASSPANALVGSAVDVGDETDPQVAFAFLNLAGGVDEVEGIGAIDIGAFKGVVGLWTDDEDVAPDYAATEKQVGFFSSSANKAKNMFYAFGKMLSNSLNWNNQQYITMPLDDDIATLGDAEALFDDKVSFVISDDQYGERLALFAAGGKAIVAPYIERNLEIDLQSAGLSFISGNQPQYTKKNATLLENSLKDVIQSYIDRGWIEAGIVTVELIENNFVASGFINISEPKALWRVFAEIRQTL